MNDKWQFYWSKMDQPAHALNSEIDYINYSEEVLFYLKNSKIMIDTGCGSGEILSFLSPHIAKIIGLDFSESMINQAKLNLDKKGIKNIQLKVCDMRDIKKNINLQADCIYNNGVIQYLSYDDLLKFCLEAKTLLKTNGKFVFMNIPSVYEKDFFSIEYFQKYRKRSFASMIYRFIRFKFWDLRQNILKNEKYDGGLGNWYSYDILKEIAEKCGMTIEFRRSIFTEYGYRFHAIMRLN